MSKKDNIKINTVALIAGLSLALSLAVCLHYVFQNPFFQCPENVVGFWGFVITAVALVVSSYIVILGFMAEKKFRETTNLINEKVESLEKSLGEAQKASGLIKTQVTSLTSSHKSLCESQNDLAESMWDSYTQQYVSLTRRGGAVLLANRIQRSRGKMGYLFPLIREKRRILCFYDLAKAGTEEDIAPLQRIVDDEFASEPIRTSAQYAIDVIRAR